MIKQLGGTHELRAGEKVSQSQPYFLGARIAQGAEEKIAREARDFFFGVCARKIFQQRSSVVCQSIQKKPHGSA